MHHQYLFLDLEYVTRIEQLIETAQAWGRECNKGEKESRTS